MNLTRDLCVKLHFTASLCPRLVFFINFLLAEMLQLPFRPLNFVSLLESGMCLKFSASKNFLANIASVLFLLSRT